MQGNGADAGIGLVNMGSVPLRAAAAEAALAGGASAADAAAVADEGTEPSADLNASAEFRRHLARVLVGRALAEAAASSKVLVRRRSRSANKPSDGARR